MRLSLAAVVFVLASTATAGPDDNRERIVGVWEIVYSDLPDAIPVGTRLEFTAAGKLVVLARDKGGPAQDLGGYKVDGESVTLSGKDGKKNDKGRIAVLNATSFVLHDEIDDKVMVMKRVKPK